MYYPARPPITGAGATFTSSVIDATGEKFAWSGRVWTPNRSTKSIRTVGFLFGTVTKAGGSGLTVSLQNVSTAATPTQPDETQDETVAIANGDAGFATNAWYQTGSLSADRSVAFGESLSVVVEYNGSGRLSSDAVNFRNLTNSLFGGAPYHTPACALKTASWATLPVVPNVILGFSDGTFGTLHGAFPTSAMATNDFNSGSATDEYALEFSVPYPCKAAGFWAYMRVASTSADFDIVLYDGTTAMTGGTVSFDANQVSASAAESYVEGLFSEQISLAANTTYRLALKPTTANSVRAIHLDVASASHFQAHDLGAAGVLTSRVDGGSWAAATATRRPFMGLLLDAFDDGAGGGGGLLAHSGMTGGFQRSK